jgi:hypothetical protein
LAVPFVEHGQLTCVPSKYFDDRWYLTPFGSYIFSDSGRRAGEYNQRLSLARANAVCDHMVSQGVPAGIIRTEGRGESDLKVAQADHLGASPV